jgi:hypothetical protein
VAFDGYNGGMDKSIVNMNDRLDREKFQTDTQNKNPK